MMNCDKGGCRDERLITIPYVVYESQMARNERSFKRLFIALILVIIMLFASNLAWLAYINQYEVVGYEQDGDGQNIVGNNNQDNEVNRYGAENYSP